jgi:hypothetical protein
MEQKFEVHLQALADIAWVLEGQIQALRPPADRLAALAPAAPPLGEFAQAHQLGERCRAAAQEMEVLLEKLGQAIGFANAVTRAVAQGYIVADEEIADEYRRAAAHDYRQASAGGNVYYSSQYNIDSSQSNIGR